MGKVIIDTYSIAALLNAEKNYEEIFTHIDKFRQNRTRMLMSVINFGELYYFMLRKKGMQAAESLESMLAGIPIEIVEAGKEEVVMAARYKAFKKMSYADCFAAALAKIHKAPVLTGDKEFKEVEGEIKVIWV